jgi:small subunit ribosomal protein S15
MYLTTEKKQEVFEKYGRSKSANDTGSAESQIALFTHRINHITQHLKQNTKDYSAELSLVKLVGKRRALLDYLIKTDVFRYRAIIKELEIRK